MAKQLLPSRRGPGRAAQREKPGDAIRATFVASPRGVTIGDCHRSYTARKLQDWQKQQIDRINRQEAAHPRSQSKQLAFAARKEKASAKIMARKRAPGTVTYAGFSRFFHYLLQLGYIQHVTDKNPATGKVTSKRVAPQMRGADGDAILDAHAAGRKVQIEPPAVYIITDLGWNAEDWNNPRRNLP